MPTPHSFYSYLKIYDGGVGERPTSGAFYVPKYGDTLSKISSKAYGMAVSTLTGVHWINRSLWNRKAAKKGAFHYRANSLSCTAKIVNPDLALTTKGYEEGAWLALCPPYPLFWIPGTKDQLPEDLAPLDDPPSPPGFTIVLPPKPGVRKKAETRTKPPVRSTRLAPGPRSTSPYYQGQGTQPEGVAAPTAPPVAEAGIGVGIPWWAWVGGAALIGGIAWFATRKKR